jgi:hypothetical protein
VLSLDRVTPFILQAVEGLVHHRAATDRNWLWLSGGQRTIIEHMFERWVLQSPREASHAQL